MGMLGAKNWKKGTAIPPASIDAIAPFSVNFDQNNDRSILGQKVAAMPDQPKITNQKMVREGDSAATHSAIASAENAMIMVTLRDNLVNGFV